MPGRIVTHTDLPSRAVTPRRVDVWLPPGYDSEGTNRYPVIYAHDGQNLFDPATAYTGVDWGLHEALERLIVQEQVRAAILVGIWNTPARVPEYLPRRPLRRSQRDGVLSDDYLRFLVAELKPLIDTTYRTLPTAPDTSILGSSMGGLISLYALCEYPQVFGGAACLSTHWPILADRSLPYLRRALPPSGRHKLYFDYGTGKGDEAYEAYQKKVDRLLQRRGYQAGLDWQTLRFAGDEHSELAWRKRVHLPLAFLLGALPLTRRIEAA